MYNENQETHKTSRKHNFVDTSIRPEQDQLTHGKSYLIQQQEKTEEDEIMGEMQTLNVMPEDKEVGSRKS